MNEKLKQYKELIEKEGGGLWGNFEVPDDRVFGKKPNFKQKSQNTVKPAPVKPMPKKQVTFHQPGMTRKPVTQTPVTNTPSTQPPAVNTPAAPPPSRGTSTTATAVRPPQRRQADPIYQAPKTGGGWITVNTGRGMLKVKDTPANRKRFRRRIQPFNKNRRTSRMTSNISRGARRI